MESVREGVGGCCQARYFHLKVVSLVLVPRDGWNQIKPDTFCLHSPSGGQV